MKKNNLREMWDIIKYTSIFIMGVPEERKGMGEKNQTEMSKFDEKQSTHQKTSTNTK